MTYRWEPTTPLDRILEAGFKRMDEAVEGVIAKYPAWSHSIYLHVEPNDEVVVLKFTQPDPVSLTIRRAEANIQYNQNLLDMVNNANVMTENVLAQRINPSPEGCMLKRSLERMGQNTTSRGLLDDPDYHSWLASRG